MLEFNKRELKFKFDGDEQKLRFPSVKDLSAYQKKYKKVGEEDSAEVVVDFLVELGLKKEVAEMLETRQVEVILKKLTEGGDEKN